MIGPNAVNQNQINNFLDTHGIQDDFEYYYDILFQDDSSHIVTHEVIPIEYDVYNKALNIDELLEGLDYEFLTEDFLLKNEIGRASCRERVIITGIEGCEQKEEHGKGGRIQ